MQNEYVSTSDEQVVAFFKGVIDSWGACVAKTTADYLESLSPECEKQVKQAIAYLRAKAESEDKEDGEFEKRLSRLEQRMDRLIDLLEKGKQP